jgi:sortase A
MRALERIFLLAGAALLTWWVVLASDAWVVQRAARESLKLARVPPIETAVPPVRPGGEPSTATVASPATPPTTGRAPGTERPAHGAPLGELSIPRIGLSAVVLHGSDAQTLRRGPGHLEQSAIPGQAGNAVIAGHRDSFFRPLRHVRSGDDIYVDTPHGRFHYRVTSLRVVRASDLSVLATTPASTLTLITCYPFWVLGPAPDRLVVRAVRTPDPATGSSPALSVGAAIEKSPGPSPAAAAWRPPPDDAIATKRDRLPAADADTLVRQAIEQFRVAYNHRLIRDGETGPGRLLAFRLCEVAIVGDHATAICSADPLPGRVSLQEWAITLERHERRWAIRSVQSP